MGKPVHIKFKNYLKYASGLITVSMGVILL
jgi:hypothetical protein